MMMAMRGAETLLSSNGFKNRDISIWRRRIGAFSTLLGFLLLAAACFEYLRYASDPSTLHLEERLQHARALGQIWGVSLYGSLFASARSARTEEGVAETGLRDLMCGRYRPSRRKQVVEEYFDRISAE